MAHNSVGAGLRLPTVLHKCRSASGDKPAATGCMRIKPDALHNCSWYEVVPFASLLSSEHILAKYDEPFIHHVSSFVSN